MRRFSTLLLPLAASAVTAAAAAPPVLASKQLPLLSPGEALPRTDPVRLSDERTITRFARAERRATVRTRPEFGARAITKLRWYTEDNYTETYMLLETRRVGGETWIKLRLPMRPNGRTGWVPRWALHRFRIVRTRLEVNRTTLRARFYDRGKLVWQSRVGVGKASTPTPSGHYWIRERIRMRGARGGVYGPWAFGTAAYSRLSEWPGGGVIGVHGTNAPQLIPGRPSHGCIRVPNHKIIQLARLMPVGTPLVIT